jgi:hypothetical protein
MEATSKTVVARNDRRTAAPAAMKSPIIVPVASKTNDRGNWSRGRSSTRMRQRQLLAENRKQNYLVDAESEEEKTGTEKEAPEGRR